MAFYLALLAVLAVMNGCAAANAGGFLTQSLFTLADCETNGQKPFAWTSVAYGECVKVFNGPEDPTTELTSFKLDVAAASGTLQLESKYQLYLDSACKKPNGPASESTITINSCISSHSQTSSGPSAEYLNQTSSLYVPEVDGLAILGFQEPSQCSANKQATYEVAFPNDACIQGSGQTKKNGPTYASFSYYCSGKDLVQTFYTDAQCAQTLSSVALKLGSVDTTCFTNQAPSYDYNLFETMACVGSAPPRAAQSATAQAESRRDIKTPCPHKTSGLHGLLAPHAPKL